MLEFKGLNRFFFLFSIFLFCGHSYGQSLNDRYNDIRKYVNKDLTLTQEKAKDLLQDAQQAKDDKVQVKALYLLAFSNMLGENSDKTFEFANQSLDLAKKIDYKEGQALALRVLGTQYARMNATNISMPYFEEALKILSNSTSQEAYEIRGLIYNSKLVALGDGSTDSEKKEKLSTSLKVVENYEHLKNQQLKEGLLISAYTNVGYNYGNLGNVDEATTYFNKALQLVSNDDVYMLASIHHDIGFTQKTAKEYQKAIASFEKALTYVKYGGEDYLSKKIEILSNLGETYALVGDDKKSSEFKNLVHQLSSKKNTKDLRLLENQLVKEKDVVQKLDQSMIWYKIAIALFGLAILIGGILFYIQTQKNRKKYYLVRESLRKINESNEYQNLSTNPNEVEVENVGIKEEAKEDEVEIETETSVASEKTLEKILLHLRSFEQSEDYLNPNYTLSKLANYCDTNPKTLSQIIRLYKKQTFNTYINQLRVTYFMNTVENDAAFRRYKLSYMAEQLGYSSSGAFSTAFKSITGILPSVYLRELKHQDS